MTDVGGEWLFGSGDVSVGQVEKMVKTTIDHTNSISAIILNREDSGATAEETLDHISMLHHAFLLDVANIFELDPLEDFEL